MTPAIRWRGMRFASRLLGGRHRADGVVIHPDRNRNMGATNTDVRSHRKNRPGIVHMMAWTLGCGLGFAAYRGLSPPWTMPAATRPLSWAYNLVMGAALGTILTGAGVLAYRRSRGDRSYPVLPGHWLLLFGLAAPLANAAAVVVFRRLLAAWFPPGTQLSAYWLPFRMARNGPDLAGMYSQCAGWGLGVVAALVFCCHLRGRVRWPWYAVFLAFLLTGVVLATGAICVTALSYGRLGWGPARVWFRRSIDVYAGFFVLGTLAILTAVDRDRRFRRPTDGLHWAGVAAWLAIAAMQLTAYIKIML
jgi:hypothetical protein